MISFLVRLGAVLCVFAAQHVVCDASSSYLTAVGGDGSSDIEVVLGPQLSSNARIYLPGSDEFTNGTVRWSSLIQPNVTAVVKVASEQDVQQTIKYANANDIPFLVKGGGHGTSTNLAKLQRGIYIWTRGMTNIKLSDDGLTATIQAGAESGEVTRTMWNLGKQIVATGCDCVGIISPMLGGGHGWLQGRYGLLTDNIISARLVLANGEVITVSDSDNTDLFWGLRGAGHNFGVVTSVEYRVFDRMPEEDNWAFEEYVFSHKEVENVFEIANRMLPNDDGTPPVQLTHFAHFERRPDVDNKNPVIVFWVIWQGPSLPSRYTSPFRALEPINIASGVVNTTGLNLLAGAAYGTPNCGDGANTMLFPVSIKSYNTTSLRAAFELYASFPNWLNNSAVLLEGYSTVAVQKVPAASTAYPDRFNNLLISPLIAYLPGTGEKDEAVRMAERFRHLLVQGSGDTLYAYVNYATGVESVQAVYGYEDWRLDRLKALKHKFDPRGKFNYFIPI